jgi:hypothetical protein
MDRALTATAAISASGKIHKKTPNVQRPTSNVQLRGRETNINFPGNQLDTVF